MHSRKTVLRAVCASWDAPCSSKHDQNLVAHDATDGLQKHHRAIELIDRRRLRHTHPSRDRCGEEPERDTNNAAAVA